jgi:hypothetical protein
MRSSFILGLVVLASAAGEARAQGAPASPTASTVPAPAVAAAAALQPSKTPPQTTAVHGTLPDLRGRWLVLFDLQTGEQQRTVPSFVEIDLKAGQVDVVEHFVRLPDEMNAQLDQATEAGTSWKPTPEQLAQIERQWANLSDDERGIVKVANEIWGKDGFDDAIRKESDVAGAVWILRQMYAFAPGGQRPGRQVNVYGAMAPEGDTWRGNVVAAVVTMAPFPIPVTYKGTFRMMRVGAPTPHGLLVRILDAFKGCGR